MKISLASQVGSNFRPVTGLKIPPAAIEEVK